MYVKHIEMKKILLSIVFFSLVMISCSSDEDPSNCYQCDVNLSGEPANTVICDNDDGTVDVTSEGLTKTIDLEGVSFEDFITAAQLLGTCSRQ